MFSVIMHLRNFSAFKFNVVQTLASQGERGNDPQQDVNNSALFYPGQPVQTAQWAKLGMAADPRIQHSGPALAGGTACGPLRP